MLCPLITQTNVVKGVRTEIQEVTFAVKNKRLNIIDVTDHRDPNRFNLSHTVLRVCLNAGEPYCLDLAGAQFRWYACLVPWATMRALLNHSGPKGPKLSCRGAPTARIVWIKS